MTAAKVKNCAVLRHSAHLLARVSRRNRVKSVTDLPNASDDGNSYPRSAALRSRSRSPLARGCERRLLPHTFCLPQMTGESASALELSRCYGAMPDLRRLAIIANAASPGSMFEMKAAETAAHALGLEAATFPLQGPDDLAAAFDKIARNVDGIFSVPDPLISTIRPQLVAMALRARLPSTFGSRDYAESGGLMSYGANIANNFARAADFVDKILRGAKPADRRSSSRRSSSSSSIARPRRTLALRCRPIWSRLQTR